MKFLLRRSSEKPVYRCPGAYRDGRDAYDEPAWYVDFASVESLLAFCTEDALILERLDGRARDGLPANVEFRIEIYDAYRE